VSDPRRATPSIRTNLDFGSDRGIRGMGMLVLRCAFCRTLTPNPQQFDERVELSLREPLHPGRIPPTSRKPVKLRSGARQVEPHRDVVGGNGRPDADPNFLVYTLQALDKRRRHALEPCRRPYGPFAPDAPKTVLRSVMQRDWCRSTTRRSCARHLRWGGCRSSGPSIA
jgi:hypothetical protein